jgi:hypothetical protein
LSAAGIDLHYPRMGIGAAQKPGPERVRAHDVGGIDRTPRYFAFSFDATERAADDAGFHVMLAPLISAINTRKKLPSTASFSIQDEKLTHERA